MEEVKKESARETILFAVKTNRTTIKLILTANGGYAVSTHSPSQFIKRKFAGHMFTLAEVKKHFSDEVTSAFTEELNLL